MKHLPLIVTLFLSVTLIIGCGTRHVPSDLPKLYPCVITVMQEGKPLEGASVSLRNTDKSAKYGTASGMTGTDGTVSMRTYGENGVPEGTYKITVQKTLSDGGEKYTDETGLERIRNEKFYSLVEDKFGSDETTPFDMTIGSGKNAQTLDVGNAVKREVQR